MLTRIDRLAVGGRAISHLAFVLMEQGGNDALVDFLTPVAKVYCTEAGMEGAELGMQVLGGYGYLKEYRLEQTYRDCRITAIYEGANGIHERVLATRLAPGPAGDAFEAFVKAEISDHHEENIQAALRAWQDQRQQLAEAKDPSILAHGFMKQTIETLLACVWARIAAAAKHHPNAARIKSLCEQA
jgi:hypothetical protein